MYIDFIENTYIYLSIIFHFTYFIVVVFFFFGGGGGNTTFVSSI